MKNNKNKTVFVGVSGGVDSSVSAVLLKEQGYNVVGVFIRTWQPDFIECTWKDERRDAMRVCAFLDIPFLECDALDVYRDGVANYMIEEYKKGNTPNPDVMCNREVKFGVFWNFAKSHGADYIATGHYSMIDLLQENSSSQSSLTPFLGVPKNGTPPPVAFQGLFSLRKSVDMSKDQSYFLWTLTSEDLSHTLFPVGHLYKTEVRKLAAKFKLPTATKKDSQGVCFLGPLDMKDFLKHYIETVNGNVENTKGEVIGNHEGVLLYTLGERHGFTIKKNTDKDEPYYIVAKDIKRNVIVVSHNKNELRQNNEIINIEKVVARDELILDKKYTAQVRYHGELLVCEIKSISDKNIEITLTPNALVDKGQSVVIYDNDICIAGGVVK